jgi:hypothetical protein
MNGTRQGRKQTTVGNLTRNSKDCPTKKRLKDMQPRTSSPLISDTWTVPPMPYWSSLRGSQDTWKSCTPLTESEPTPQSS